MLVCRPSALPVRGKLQNLFGHDATRTPSVEFFLRKPGLSEEAARFDSEGIEHHVGKETLNAIQRVRTEG